LNKILLYLSYMKLVTVATQDDGYFKWLKQSCKRYNYDLVILGYGEKWQGFNWRLQQVMKYVEQADPDEIICCIDAYDVIMLRDSKEMERAFIEIHDRERCKIVIATEITDKNILWKLLGLWLFGSNINAGTYIGYAKDILYILKKAQQINDKPNADDQLLLAKITKHNPIDIYIDNDNELFLTILKLTFMNNSILHTTNLSITDNKLYYKKHRPFILHVPANMNMVDVIQKLGYNITDEEIQCINSTARDYMIRRNIYYLSQTKNIYVILFIVIVIVLVILARRRM
jgi:hypothetical protein